MLITALCVLGCSAIAFRVGYGLRRDVIMVWKSAYCKGAVDMFHGLIAELGMKVVQTKSPEAPTPGSCPQPLTCDRLETPAVVCRLHTLNRRRG